MVNVEAAQQQIISTSVDGAAVSELLNGKLHLTPHPVWDMPPSIAWETDPFQSEDWRCRLHMLRWLEPLREAGADGNAQAQQAWIRYTRDWVQQNPPRTAAGTEAWSERIVGIRAVQLVQAVPMIAMCSPEDLDWLVTSIRAHGEWLADEKHLARSHQALLSQQEGLLLCGLVLEERRWTDLVVRRLTALFNEQWDSEGINVEGSIVSHRDRYAQWKQALGRIRRAGLPFPPEFDALEGTPFELAHATRPDGTFAPIGDTGRESAAHIDHPACRYVTSHGGKGVPPTDLVRVYQDGYVFGRSGWGEFERDFSQETFFSLTFGRSKVNGHDDSGAVTYSAQGQHWMSGPGESPCTTPDRMHPHALRRQNHSLFYLEGRERDRSKPMTLHRSSTEGAVWDFLLKDHGYEGARISRRLLYSTGGEYLVIVDTVRSDEDVTGVQRWQTGPGVTAETEPRLVTLRAGGGSAGIYSSGTRCDTDVVEASDELGGDGRATARRQTAVLLRKAGTAFRFITAVAAGHQGAPSFSTLQGLPRGYFGLRVSNGMTSESLVVGARDSRVFSADTAVEEINAVLSASVQDSESAPAPTPRPRAKPAGYDPEVRRLALNLMSTYREKGWSADREGRLRLAEEFRAEASDLGLPPSMDLGISSCAADLASQTRPENVDASMVRGGLLNWDSNRDWRPTFYDVPVITHRQELAPASVPEEAAIHTIDHGSLVTPAYLAPEAGDILTVMFHGAIHRGKTRVPIFQRLSSQLGLQAGPTLAFADPTLDLAADLRIGWYLGHEGIDLPAHLAETIRTVAERLGTKKLVLGGNSGGGFAALQVSTFLPESTVVAFSPQTDLREYFAVPSRMAYEAAFGRRRAPTIARHRARISVLERLKATRQIGRVVLVSNPGDELHVKAHEKPLLAALAHRGTSEARVENIDMGQGHKAPSAETYEQVMRRVYAEL